MSRDKQDKSNLKRTVGGEKIAGWVANEFYTLSAALNGEADRLDRDAQASPDRPLMEAAGTQIVCAACEGLTLSMFDLEKICPDAASLMARYQAVAAVRAVRTGESDCSGESLLCPADAEPSDQAGTTRADDGTSTASDDDDRRSAAIEELLAIERQQTAVYEAHGVNERKVIAMVWEYLSEKYPEKLSPEAARIKRELLPGIDPWFGLSRDYRKAGWVCWFLAEEIAQRCDLTIAEAAKTHGVPPGTISRACKRGDIKTNGQSHKALLMNRHSFLQWNIQHQRRNKAVANKAKSPLPKKKEVWEFQCKGCGARFPAGEDRCPKCNNGSFEMVRTKVK